MSNLRKYTFKALNQLLIVAVVIFIASCNSQDYPCNCGNRYVDASSIDSICTIINNILEEGIEQNHFKIMDDSIFKIVHSDFIWYTNIKNIDCQSYTYTIWSKEKATVGINIIDNAKKVDVRSISGEFESNNQYESLDFSIKPAELIEKLKNPLCDLLCKIQELKMKNTEL